MNFHSKSVLESVQYSFWGLTNTTNTKSGSAPSIVQYAVIINETLHFCDISNLPILAYTPNKCSSLSILYLCLTCY